MFWFVLLRCVWCWCCGVVMGCVVGCWCWCAYCVLLCLLCMHVVWCVGVVMHCLAVECALRLHVCVVCDVLL